MRFEIVFAIASKKWLGTQLVYEELPVPVRIVTITAIKVFVSHCSTNYGISIMGDHPTIVDRTLQSVLLSSLCLSYYWVDEDSSRVVWRLGFPSHHVIMLQSTVWYTFFMKIITSLHIETCFNLIQCKSLPWQAILPPLILADATNGSILLDHGYAVLHTEINGDAYTFAERIFQEWEHTVIQLQLLSSHPIFSFCCFSDLLWSFPFTLTSHWSHHHYISYHHSKRHCFCLAAILLLTFLHQRRDGYSRMFHSVGTCWASGAWAWAWGSDHHLLR